MSPVVSPVVRELVKLVEELELELPLVVVVVDEQWLWQPPPLPFAPTAKADGSSINPTTASTSTKARIAFFKRFTSFLNYGLEILGRMDSTRPHLRSAKASPPLGAVPRSPRVMPERKEKKFAPAPREPLRGLG